jgi:hypothetical protein
MQTKIQAVRALRKIVRGNDDLVTFDAELGWTFDEESAHYLADLQPENDARGQESIRKTTEAPMNEENTQSPDVRVETFETVSLADAEIVSNDDVTESSDTTDGSVSAEPETTKPAKPETARQREKREAKERNQAARAARAAEKAEIKAKRDAKLAEGRAKRQAEEEAKAKRKAERKAKAEAAAAERASNAARREANAAQRQAEKQNGVYKPKPGSLLNHLWSIIEKEKEALGRMPTFDEYAERIRGLADHGTPLTQTTAYYNYRRFHGIKVRERKVYPVEAAASAESAV